MITLLLIANMLGGVGTLMGPVSGNGTPGPSEFVITTEADDPITTEAPDPEALRVETP